MAKYETLNRFFRVQTGGLLRMTFDEVEREAGFTLPASARLHQAWWANDRSRHVQAKAWLDAGYETEQVDMKAHTLVFKRVAARPFGMADEASEYLRDASIEKNRGRHPAIGAMKGPFSADPAWDPTKPAMSEEDLAEMNANVRRTADLVDAGSRGMPQNVPPYKHARPAEKKPRRSPLFGALKGTFWVDPNWDLTKPAMSEDELAEMFANIERTADLIEAGLRKKSS